MKPVCTPSTLTTSKTLRMPSGRIMLTSASYAKDVLEFFAMVQSYKTLLQQQKRGIQHFLHLISAESRGFFLYLHSGNHPKCRCAPIFVVKKISVCWLFECSRNLPVERTLQLRIIVDVHVMRGRLAASHCNRFPASTFERGCNIDVYWFWLTVLFVKTDVVYTLVVLFLTGLSVYGLIPDQVYTISVIPNLVVTPKSYS